MNVVEEIRELPLLEGLKKRLEKDFVQRWINLGEKSVLEGINPGADAIRLDGNDYLNLTGHPSIVNAQISQLQQKNDFVIQSGVYLNDMHPTKIFEKQMSQFIGKNDVFLSQSGFAANVGLLQIIANKDTPVYLDMFAHMSLWEGVKAAGSNGYAFKHNSPESLKKLIGLHGPGIVVVDSVYSTNGALCPLIDFLEVVEATNSMIVVDESHSLGIHGPKGAGLCAELNITERVHFITASLAKSFAARAGIFTMPTCLKHFAMNSSYPHIFSSCLLPYEVAGLIATLEVIKNSDEKRLQLQINKNKVRKIFQENGFPVHTGTEQIICLEAGPELVTARLRDEMEKRNIFGAVFCAPATSLNRSMLRLTIPANLIESQIIHIEKSVKEIAPIVKPWEWRSAKRI